MEIMSQPAAVSSLTSPSSIHKEDEKEEDYVPYVQTLLRISEVFLYRIPPMKSSGGHRAEDWNLAQPLETCRLVVERMDDSCVLKFWLDPPSVPSPSSNTTSPPPSRLFAQAIWTVSEKNETKDDSMTGNHTTTTTISSSSHPIVEPVVDSSRYFVVTIVDPIHHRRAYIGIGFRERMDAISLTMALQDYERSRQRELLARKQQLEYQHESPEQSTLENHPVSSLPKESCNRSYQSTVVPVLRKKPPPPSSSTTTSKEDLDNDEWTDFQ